MSRSKIESIDALEALYGSSIESDDPEELFDKITVDMVNYFSSDELNEFVEHCINDH